VGNPQDGLSFSKFNYGLGLQISIPILQFARTGKLTGRQDILISSSEAYEIQLERAFEKERTVAKVTLRKALESAQLAPDYFHAATFTYEALKARYDAGLIDLNEFVQGQAELAKAEADKIKVQAEMWKALLYYAAVFGDIDVFIQSLP
jgi:outer membrane protein TolC